jgi:hypothetical protein
MEQAFYVALNGTELAASAAGLFPFSRLNGMIDQRLASAMHST